MALVDDKFTTTVLINSEPSLIWGALTDSTWMLKWLGEPEMKLEIDTDWRIGSPIFIRGFHHVKFENKGIVLEYVKDKRLVYSHLSSLSRLPDMPASYSILEFELAPQASMTQLNLTITNFPTDSIRKHLEFYWRATILRIKNSIEEE